MKYFTIAILLVFSFAQGLQAQSSADCIDAISICDTTYFQSQAPPDVNPVTNEINTFTSCLSPGEIPGRWYKFATLDSGMLSFSIIPTDTSADFDFALFDLTNKECGATSTDPSAEVRCNFSGIGGNEGITGANGGGHPTETDTLPVDSNMRFYLYICSYSGDNSSYTIDFTASTVTFKDCAEVGINDEPALKFEIFPNPTQEAIAVVSPDYKDLHYTLYDPTGRIIQEGNVYGMISVKDLPAGIYTIAVDNGQTVAFRKFVKN